MYPPPKYLTINNPNLQQLVNREVLWRDADITGGSGRWAAYPTILLIHQARQACLQSEELILEILLNTQVPQGAGQGRNLRTGPAMPTYDGIHVLNKGYMWLGRKLVLLNKILHTHICSG